MRCFFADVPMIIRDDVTGGVVRSSGINLTTSGLRLHGSGEPLEKRNGFRVTLPQVTQTLQFAVHAAIADRLLELRLELLVSFPEGFPEQINNQCEKEAAHPAWHLQPTSSAKDH